MPETEHGLDIFKKRKIHNYVMYVCMYTLHIIHENKIFEMPSSIKLRLSSGLRISQPETKELWNSLRCFAEEHCLWSLNFQSESTLSIFSFFQLHVYGIRC